MSADSRRARRSSGIGDSEPRTDGLAPLEAAVADIRETLDSIAAQCHFDPIRTHWSLFRSRTTPSSRLPRTSVCLPWLLGSADPAYRALLLQSLRRPLFLAHRVGATHPRGIIRCGSSSAAFCAKKAKVRLIRASRMRQPSDASLPTCTGERAAVGAHPGGVHG